METELCFYDRYLEELKGSVISKARKFNRLNLVKRTGENSFAVLPIPGYNSSTYTVTFEDETGTCNCQANRINNRVCSHMMAVSLFIKTRENETPNS